MRDPVMRCTLPAVAWLVTLSAMALADQPEMNAERGALQWRVAGPHTAGPALVEAILPASYDPAGRYRVLYVLPVEADLNHRFGDPVKLMTQLKVADQHDLICVFPTFASQPWYGDHVSDPQRAQERFVIQSLVPEVDRQWSTVAAPEGRLLLGYSKSGWGAFCLIARHPGVFGYAASWDAPLMFDARQYGIWATDHTFGSAEQMGKLTPMRSLVEHADAFRARTRLVLSGEKLFGASIDKRYTYDGPSHTVAAHELLQQHGIRHVYLPDIDAGHSWNARWVRPVLEALLRISEPQGAEER